MAEHVESAIVSSTPVALATAPSATTRVSATHLAIAALASIALQAVPWWDIVYGQMINEDLENYLQHPYLAGARLERLYDDSVLSLLAHEPLWLTINHLLAINNLPADILLDAAGYVCWFGVVLFFLAERIPGSFYIFIVNPYFIDLVTIHQRQGIALGVVLIGEAFGGVGMVIGSLIAPLLHTSSALFVGSWLYRRVSLRLPRFKIQGVVLLIFAVVIAVEAVNLFFADLGDKRAMYAEARQDSRLYALPWVLCAVVLMLEKQLRNQMWTHSAYVVFAVAAFTFTSGGSNRMVEGGFPFLIVATSTLTGWRRTLTFVALVFFQFIQYVYKYTYMYR